MSGGSILRNTIRVQTLERNAINLDKWQARQNMIDQWFLKPENDGCWMKECTLKKTMSFWIVMMPKTQQSSNALGLKRPHLGRNTSASCSRPSRHSNLRLFEGGSCDISGVSFVISGGFFRHFRGSSNISEVYFGISGILPIFLWN